MSFKQAASVWIYHHNDSRKHEFVRILSGLMQQGEGLAYVETIALDFIENSWRSLCRQEIYRSYEYIDLPLSVLFFRALRSKSLQIGSVHGVMCVQELSLLWFVNRLSIRVDAVELNKLKGVLQIIAYCKSITHNIEPDSDAADDVIETIFRTSDAVGQFQIKEVVDAWLSECKSRKPPELINYVENAWLHSNSYTFNLAHLNEIIKLGR